MKMKKKEKPKSIEEHIAHLHRKHRRHVINTSILIAVVSLMLIAYFSYVILDVETEYKSMINQRTKDFNRQLVEVTGMLSSEINNTKTELNSEIEILESLLEKTRQENQRLSQAISDVEAQTNVQIKELKGELTKSGDFSEIAADALNSVVSITTDKGQGSGVIITTDGFIVTNYHVVKDAKAAKVLTYDGKIHRTALVGINPSLDIAVLKIGGSFQKLDFADSDDIKAGQKVIALGNPAGLDFSVTEGIVSAVNRKAPNGNLYIQTDVPVNPGNSGGPLVDKTGKLVGIVNFKIEGMESIGFALPSNTVKEAVDGIIK